MLPKDPSAILRLISIAHKKVLPCSEPEIIGNRINPRPNIPSNHSSRCGIFYCEHLLFQNLSSNIFSFTVKLRNECFKIENTINDIKNWRREFLNTSVGIRNKTRTFRNISVEFRNKCRRFKSTSRSPGNRSRKASNVTVGIRNTCRGFGNVTVELRNASVEFENTIRKLWKCIYKAKKTLNLIENAIYLLPA